MTTLEYCIVGFSLVMSVLIMWSGLRYIASIGNDVPRWGQE